MMTVSSLFTTTFLLLPLLVVAHTNHQEGNLLARHGNMMNPVVVGLTRAFGNVRNNSVKNDIHHARTTPPPPAFPADMWGSDLVTSSSNSDADEEASISSMMIHRRGGASVVSESSNFLKAAYTSCGAAMAAAWTTVVYTTIRSNQPKGAMMPSWQHGFYARIGALAALPLMLGSFQTCFEAAGQQQVDTWEAMGSTSCRRHNLGLAVAGFGSALWTQFAHVVTRIPGSDPPASHQVYKGIMKTGLTGCFAATGVLGVYAWARSLPEDERKNPLVWPGRIADGVCKSLFSLKPANLDDPVNVKYAALATSFIVFTGLQLGSHPLSAIPSWTGRRLSRIFASWTALAAITCFDLKEERERSGTAPLSPILSKGVKGFGVTYLAARFGAVFLDPSFPESYHAVVMVPAWAIVGIIVAGLTLPADTPWEAPTAEKMQAEGVAEINLDDVTAVEQAE